MQSSLNNIFKDFVIMDGDKNATIETFCPTFYQDLDEAGSYVVVPKGTWHTARLPGLARMLFVTPGQGTENKVM